MEITPVFSVAKEFPSCLKSYMEFFYGFDIFIYYLTVTFRTLVALGVHSGHIRVKLLTAIFAQKCSNMWPDRHASCI
jgi:hypothetical protein